MGRSVILDSQKDYLRKNPLKIDLRDLPLFSAREASLKLGKSPSYIRQLYNNYPEKLLQGTVAKIGNVLVITQEGVDYLAENGVKEAVPDEVNGYLTEELIGAYFAIKNRKMQGDLRLMGIPYSYTVVANEAMPLEDDDFMYVQIRKINGSELLVAIVNHSEVSEEQLVRPRFIEKDGE
ncbi:hypothetical protein PECL_739 [Pediococcus claussenii ATCC BAA-344]|uniref:Uncharacterized protein n=1 Tax=Pediococcus claussenii (strain ATCC BAA-344 / DSM 14800 / JCM 18046 / KCTC 3811 / LMG 21948 / P06) TaxID=701521 RepID=G8PCP5_PEDCP|nr:hypothetical protein PECL_739 [Pediococcus claussenii ATCC BAA-344]